MLTDTHAPSVHISESANGGWDLRIAPEGEAPITEHYSDWHRLERRRAILALPATADAAHPLAAAEDSRVTRTSPHAPAAERAISH